MFPKITIATAVVNSVNTIEKSINSVISQCYPNLEYMMVDGGSSDGTEVILDAYSEHFTYYISEKDSGPAEAYNKILPKISGDIVGFLNADDFYHQGILFELGELVNKYHDTDVFSFACDVIKYDSLGKSQQLAIFNKPDQLDISPHNLFSGLSLFNAKFYKKSFFASQGFRTSQVFGSEMVATDIDFLLKILKDSARVKIFPEIMAISYLSHHNSRTFDPSFKDKVKLYKENLILLTEYAKEQTDKSMLLSVRYSIMGRILLCLLLSGDFKEIYQFFKKNHINNYFIFSIELVKIILYKLKNTFLQAIKKVTDKVNR